MEVVKTDFYYGITNEFKLIQNSIIKMFKTITEKEILKVRLDKNYFVENNDLKTFILKFHPHPDEDVDRKNVQSYFDSLEEGFSIDIFFFKNDELLDTMSYVEFSNNFKKILNTNY